MHTRMQRAAAKVQREERQKEREESRRVEDQKSLFCQVEIHFLVSKWDLSLSALLFCHILEGPSLLVRRRRHLTYIK